MHFFIKDFERKAEYFCKVHFDFKWAMEQPMPP